MDELLAAKANLYRLLIEKGHDDLTINEVELMWHCSIEPGIQDLFSRDASPPRAVEQKPPTSLRAQFKEQFFFLRKELGWAEQLIYSFIGLRDEDAEQEFVHEAYRTELECRLRRIKDLVIALYIDVKSTE